jgi:hypothetical protein
MACGTTASVELMESGFNQHAELQLKDADGKCQGKIPVKTYGEGGFGRKTLPAEFQLIIDAQSYFVDV